VYVALSTYIHMYAYTLGCINVYTYIYIHTHTNQRGICSQCKHRSMYSRIRIYQCLQTHRHTNLHSLCRISLRLYRLCLHVLHGLHGLHGMHGLRRHSKRREEYVCVRASYINSLHTQGMIYTKYVVKTPVPACAATA